MSDTSQGEGWWIASDGKWYPPESAPTPAPPAQQPPAGSSAAQQPPTQQQPSAQQPPPLPGQADQPPPLPGQAQQPPPVAGQGAGTPRPFPATPTGPGGPGGPPDGTDGDGEDDDSKGGKGKWIALVIVLLLIAGVVAFFLLRGDNGDSDDKDGKGDKTEQTTGIGEATGDLVNDGPIEFNKEYTAKLEADRTEARFTLDAPAGAIMTVEVTNDAASAKGAFTSFDSQGDNFLGFRVSPNGSDTQQVILDSDGAAQFELTFTEGPAKFTFKVGLEIQDDAGQGGDAGSTSGSAFGIKAGQGVAGMLGGEDDTDHYTVDLEPGSELTLKAATTADSEKGSYFTLELDGENLFAERVAPGADTDLSLLLSDQDSGTLDVIVTEGAADYTFTVDFVEQNDGGDAGDAPSTLAEARTADPAAAIEGQVGDRDEGDFYTFTAPGPTFNVSATSDKTNEKPFYVTVQDASGSNVAGFRVAPGATETKPVEVEPGSEVRLEITEGRAKYSVKVG